MWCRRQAAAAILPLLLAGWLTGESSEALTTFGKSNAPAPKDVAPIGPIAKECFKPSDCLAVSSSSCVRTHYEAKTRCLCGDNSAPINGQCEAQTKSLYHLCSGDECNDGMVCGIPNATGGLPSHLKMLGPKDNICLCDVENGFREKDHTCNDADILKTSMIAIVVVTCIRKMLVY